MNALATKAPKGYVLSIWADAWGSWGGRVNFLTPLGNTPEAERVKANGLRALKRGIREEMLSRNLIGGDYRVKWEIVKNQTELGTGRLVSLTVIEGWKGFTNTPRDYEAN